MKTKAATSASGQRGVAANGLNAKQQRFVDEYLVDGNATRAAEVAGYSKKTAYSQGARLLKNVEVAQAIASRAKIIHDKLELDQEYVRRGLKKVADLSMDLVGTEVKRGKRKVRVQTYDPKAATKALELIGKDQGMFKPDVNVNVTGNMPLEQLLQLLPEAVATLAKVKP